MSRPAPYANPLSYAEEALDTERGIIVNVGSRRVARNLRMNFYAKRALAREQGEDKYDSISCVVEETNVFFLKEELAKPKVRAI